VPALTNREIGVRGVEYAEVIGAIELCHDSAMPVFPAWDWPTDVHTHSLLLLAISTLVSALINTASVAAICSNAVKLVATHLVATFQETTCFLCFPVSAFSLGFLW